MMEDVYRSGFLLGALFALVTLPGFAADFIPPEQFANHLVVQGMEQPSIPASACSTKTIKFNAEIDDHGRIEVGTLQERKNKRQLLPWPKDLVKKASQLLVRAYPPFFIGGKPSTIRTILYVQCVSKEASSLSAAVK